MITPVSAATPASAMKPTATATDSVEAQPPHQPDAADQRERQRQHDDQRLGQPAEVEVEQQEDDRSVSGTTIFSRASARSRYSNWPLQAT
jgi:hypothetical protein